MAQMLIERFDERYPFIVKKLEENFYDIKVNNKEVGLDLDAVTQATYIMALNYASHTLGKCIDKDQLTSYWELSNIARKLGMSESESLQFTQRAFNRKEVFEKSPEMHGIRPLLSALDTVKVNYSFSSARPPIFKNSTDFWFTSEFPSIKSEDVQLGRKGKMTGGEYKATIIKQRNIALFIEDSFEDVLDILTLTDSKMILVPQPWNIDKFVDNKRLKKLKPYSGMAGIKQVLEFLISDEAKDFLKIT